MSMAALFERLAGALFGGAKPADTEAERVLVTEMIDAVVEAVEPKVRMHARYRQNLETCVRKTIAYLREIGRTPLEPVLLARATWASDPRVNAFFATADDVPDCLGRSQELRRFFDQNAALQEAYALLGMKKEERSVLGMDLQGDTVQRDVQQTVVSFGGHRIVAPSATLAGARLEIGKRIILRLAQAALARIVAVDEKATELGEHKAYLGAKLRMLRLAQDGMEGIVKDPATIGAQMKAVEQQLKETVEGYIEAKGSLATLEGYLGHIDEVFSQPAKYLSLAATPLRLSHMGTKVEGEASGPTNELTLAELSIGADFRAAIAIVLCPRAELPSKADLIAQAERSL